MCNDKNCKCCKEIKDRPFNIITITYSAADLAASSGTIKREPKMFALQAQIQGDTDARVNGKLLRASLAPATVSGDSWEWGGTELTEYKGKILVEFATPAGANPLIEISQAFYTD